MASPAERGAGPLRVLVTGVAGFTGRHVAAELRRAGHAVVGLTHANGDTAAGHVAVDLRDRAAVLDAVGGLDFDAVVHLAAISFVAHDDAAEIYSVNVVGARNLLDAVARSGADPRAVVLASSANVYGNATTDPIGEDAPTTPANDYAVSKLAMEHMARLWADRLPVILTRPFNYTGVGQPTHFLVPKIVDHFRRGARVIELGNTAVWRDFSDVRAVARHYRRLVELAPACDTVNLCSGAAHSLDDVLALMADIAGYEIEVRVDPELVRAHEVVRLVGDRALLDSLLGDDRPIPLRETLTWMYEA